MAKKEIPIIGIDIGSHAVKVCQIEPVRKGGYELKALGAAAISPGAVDDGVLQDAQDVSAAIAELLKNLKIKNKRVGLSISGYSVIVKKINIDIESEEALEERLHQEAEQYIPFDINEVYLDHQVIKLAKSDTERSEVMLVAAKKEVVDRYLDMLQAMKLLPVLVDVDGFALENIWNIVGGSEKNVCLVDIGASKMSINIIAGGTSVLARDVATGSDKISQEIAEILDIEYTDAEKIKLGRQPAKDDDMEELHGIFTRICTRWVLEIKKAIDLYGNNNPGRPLVSLVLSGGGAKVHGLRDYLAKETGLEVIAFNPFENMKIDKKIDMEYL
ncbi:type IV pilus assembly protein PilM, partial [Desulfobulbus sp. F4]|nr:type IV pilus assembly protein PilM [Desulfobulbus sp. F4]